MRYEIHGKWKVDKFQEIDKRDKNNRKIRTYVAECLGCNTEHYIRYADVKNGSSTQCRSCGTRGRDKLAYSNNSGKTKHGLSGTRIYRIYHLMKQRCYTKSSTAYAAYGAMGVYICDEWLNNFQAFYDWSMDNGYSDELQIDKDIRHDGEQRRYSPETCSWVTPSENSSESATRNKVMKNKLTIVRNQIASRTLKDSDIDKVRKMLSIELEYSDIKKVVNIDDARISKIRHGQYLKISELKEKYQINDIV